MHFLLINPYICDFACYDYWMKPLGLLYLSALLKEKGYSVSLLDCMDRHHPLLPKTADEKSGRGNYISIEIEKPDVLRKYPRKYRIYGISGELLEQALKNMEKPDKVIISSSMTYWYPGVKGTAETVRKIFPETEIILGGIYATLCRKHAEKNMPADRVISGGDFKEFFSMLGKEIREFSDWPAPDYSAYSVLPYAAVRTSMGCPRSCSYCGIKTLFPFFVEKSERKIREEIAYIKEKHGVKDFVLYDDSLLLNTEFLKYLENPDEEVRFHTPNALEVKRVDGRVSLLLKEANFSEPCLAIDIPDSKRMKEESGKLELADIEKAVNNLLEAGYSRGSISSYIILGLPGQTLSEVRRGVEFVHSLGVKIYLAEYAVVPYSPDAEKFPREIMDEPLLHNNSIFPSYEISEWPRIQELKQYTRRLNNEL